MKRIITGTTIAVMSIVVTLSIGYFVTSRCDRAISNLSNHDALSALRQSNKDRNMTIAPPPLIASPLRASTKIHLNASPEEVFEYISSAESLPLWMPGLESVTYDHSNSVLLGTLNEGSQRTMMFGDQQETETIVQFERPNVIAYQIIEGVPLKNHVATMTVESDGGGSTLTWNQHFELKRTSVYGWLMPFMVRRFLNDAQANLTDKFGGEAISACRSKL